MSRAIARAAQKREESRGAHYREDYPEAGALAESAYIVLCMEEDKFELSTEPVAFTLVKPGESLIDGA